MISSYSWVEVSEASRRQAKGWIQRLFGSFFSLGAPQDLTILGGLLVIAYLAIGEHAQLVCNLTTALPDAFFTYQLLTGPTNVSAYKSALTYWTLQGSLLLFDHLFNDSSAFFVAKFLILHAVLYHIQRISQQPNEEHSSEAGVKPNWDPRLTSDDTLASQYIDPFLSATEVTAAQRHKSHQPGFKNAGYAPVNIHKNVPAQYRSKPHMQTGFFKETLGSAVSDFSENSMFITPNDGQCRSPLRRQARDALSSAYTDAKTAQAVSASWFNDSHGP
ncbi:Protein Y48B6A.5, partial [Aphelenchoides avenae]